MSSSVVADLKQAPRINGKFAKEQAILQREGVKVPLEIVERVNQEFEEGHNGLFYVINQEATEEREIQQEKNRQAREEKAKLEKVSLADIVDGIKEKGSKKKEVEIDETKRADGTDKELITNIGSVADNHDLARKGNFTKEQLEAMSEDEIKLIAGDLLIKIGNSGTEKLIEKIIEKQESAVEGSEN